MVKNSCETVASGNNTSKLVSKIVKQISHRRISIPLHQLLEIVKPEIGLEIIDLIANPDISRIPDSSDDDIPRDYEKTSEFCYIKKIVKKLNKSKFLDYFDKCRECNKLFHDPNLGSYCEKHILNKLGCCRNHCCIDEEFGHCKLHCIKKFETYGLFDIDTQSEDAISS